VTLTGAFEPAPQKGELATYRFYLDGHRRVLAAKCEGLDADALAKPGVPPSDLSLMGLVRHLARVEHYWFRMVIDEHLDDERLDADDPTGGFHRVASTQESVDAAFGSWREQIAYAGACLDRLTEADLASSRTDRHGEELSVREVLLHMVEEYARHNGHADLLRERIDGRTGL
jgi:uncharacterized damage-inducible protein DinB